MPLNLVLPHGMKAFLFITNDDSLDSRVEDTIMFLARKYGWKECYPASADTDIKYGGGAVALTLQYLIPFEELK